MRRVLLIALTLCACSEPDPPPAAVRYPILPKADAESVLKIDKVRHWCEKFDRKETTQVVGAVAFRGQKLRWLGVVRLTGEHTVKVGVGSLLLHVRMQEWQEVPFEVGEIVEVKGVVKYLDFATRIITLLDPEVTAGPAAAPR